VINGFDCWVFNADKNIEFGKGQKQTCKKPQSLFIALIDFRFQPAV